MKRKGTFIALVFAVFTVHGQVRDYQDEYNAINKNLMLGLGSYAVSNFMISGVGYTAAQTEENRRFHEMNILWNTVNLGLAVPGFLKAVTPGETWSEQELRDKQKHIERLFLVNSALDIGYVAGGMWMRKNAENRSGQSDLFRGYGSSLIFQGSFLLAFDLFAYSKHHRHGKELFLIKNLSLRPSLNGVTLSFTLDG